MELVVIALAVWRISNLLSDTDQTGPFNILTWIRIKAGMKYDMYSQPTTIPGSFADMLMCVYCNSVWIGLIFTLLYLYNQEVTFFVSLPFALSAVAIIIQEGINHASK